MISQELLLLGLIKEGHRHGYDIKTKIREILSLFAGVKLKSIYYPLRILEKNGLVEKHVDKLGRRPQRLVYKLSSKGEKRFNQLLSESLLDFTRPQFSLDLSLYFLHYMKPKTAKRRLRARLLILNKIARGLDEMVRNQKTKDSPLSRILEHNRQMLQAESKFLSHLVQIL